MEHDLLGYLLFSEFNRGCQRLGMGGVVALDFTDYRFLAKILLI